MVAPGFRQVNFLWVDWLTEPTVCELVSKLAFDNRDIMMLSS